MSNESERVARTRCGKVTLKRGGSLQLLRKPVSPERGCVEAELRRVLDNHTNAAGDRNVAGFAFVVWDGEGGSTAGMELYTVEGGKTIPGVLVPDFVRNRLLAGKIEQWTLNTINESK
jgi:hypothetical protein